MAVKWFYSFLKPYRGRIALGLLLTTLIAALSIVNPYLSGMIVDDVIQAGRVRHYLIYRSFTLFVSGRL